MRGEPPPCPDSVSGRHSPLDVHGKCSWCGRKVDRTAPGPERFGRSGHDDSELGTAYRYHYDPDYEGHNDYD